MKLRFIVAVLTFASLRVFALAADSTSSQFSVDQSTIAPGTVLKPGSYSIRIVDHLQDRYLVSVDGKNGSSHSIFIAVPAKALSGHVGAINWTSASHGEAALRGFAFNKRTSPLEFVYPKDQAVTLAKANGIGVLAVDPASEGKPSNLAELSNDDMQIVTLWMLTPQRVGAQDGDVKIAASKYEHKEAPGSTQQLASLSRPAVLKRLPHTASVLPLILAIGMFTAFLASLLRVFRRVATAA